MKTVLSPLLAIVVVASLVVGNSQIHGADDASRWEKDIREFEAADAENPPAKGGTLFVGSSSIRMWKTLDEDFPGRQTINRGFGGSQMSDLLAYMDRIVLPYEPSTILVYEGDNDLANDKSPELILEQFKTFVERVHRQLPETHVAFIAVKPSVARKHLLDKVQQTNGLIADYARNAEGVSYVDIANPMLDKDGQPKKELFIDDMLHLNSDGYALWTSIVRRHLEQVE